MYNEFSKNHTLIIGEIPSDKLERRMDDLGRVVIPKSIRNSLGLKEGDKLEVKEVEGNIVISKKETELGKLIKYVRLLGKDNFIGLLKVIDKDYCNVNTIEELNNLIADDLSCGD